MIVNKPWTCYLVKFLEELGSVCGEIGRTHDLSNALGLKLPEELARIIFGIIIVKSS
jgi:hypothetical protein